MLPTYIDFINKKKAYDKINRYLHWLIKKKNVHI